MANDLTSPKGLNGWPTDAKLAAKDVGMVTDGASLEKGYKVVSPQGNSPQAQALNTHPKTPGAPGSYRS